MTASRDGEIKSIVIDKAKSGMGVSIVNELSCPSKVGVGEGFIGISSDRTKRNGLSGSKQTAAAWGQNSRIRAIAYLNRDRL